jgi:predicted nucleic-acid-binding protein
LKALDTNVIVRFLINDDKTQGRKARVLFENAERTGERYLIGTTVLLETIWVLSAVYDLAREDVLHALELLTQIPILEFESYETVLELVRLGATTNADLPDLLIGLSGKAAGCESTLTFDKGLGRTGLFERL